MTDYEADYLCNCMYYCLVKLFVSETLSYYCNIQFAQTCFAACVRHDINGECMPLEGCQTLQALQLFHIKILLCNLKN